MEKKLIAIVIAAALVLALTACGKGGKNKKNEPFGYRKYTITTDSGIEEGRELAEEYENHGTESTLISDDEGKAYDIRKWFYDETGEKLLKEVAWSKGSPTVAKEWDANGRLISYSQKKEEDNDTDFNLEIPTEYNAYDDREYLVKNIGGKYFTRKSVKELQTEITYRGDTDEIATIRTVTDQGDVVASLERGEGDIILSETWEGSYQASYGEAYDEATRTGYGSEQNEDGMICGYIEKTYDENGKLTRVLEYSCTDGWKTLEYDTSIVYSEDGSSQVYRIQYYTYLLRSDSEELAKWYETHYSYDADQRLTEEIVFRYPIWEEENYTEKRFDSSKTYTYYENGQLKKEEQYEFDEETSQVYPSYTVEYDKEGNELSEEYYTPDGYYSSVSTYEYTDDPAVCGKVLHTVTKRYGGQEEPKEVTELWKCSYSVVREYDSLVTYRREYTGEGVDDVSTTPVYDKDGYLSEIKWAMAGYEETTELDRKGRIVHNIFKDPDDNWSSEVIYEYWEGKKEQ